MTGFEPATPASRTQCSTRLSYTPTCREKRRGKHNIGGSGVPLLAACVAEKRAPLYAAPEGGASPARLT